ncbi:cyclic-nucleotide 2-phosphodiesterase [Moniliophthora roreri MCA 2997]|uniref:Cyclic-nucleotide 2-phosphodiesterase n=2 Tax=Moniliophthora roreri TaxID=221103 RepID=V2X4Q1_MONRO|nr:cyclic-nucleotide 2-phosphodiesterase [Moniliophthora roreri MCA 2997]
MSLAATIDNETQLVFLHFNDVYHVSQLSLLARFAHVFKDFKLKYGSNGLTVFSGDALGPSLEGSVLKGGHIVPVLNHLEIDIACYGNHDFDFGEDRLRELSLECNFPWVLSNAFHGEEGGELLASAKEYVIQECNGYRIGFFGLAGTDWPSNCQHLPKDTVIQDPAVTARRLARKLRTEEDVDVVIAISHMRLEEDRIVSEACASGDSKVDIILGGHDHEAMVEGETTSVQRNEATGRIRIVKSGTDFRSYSVVRLAVSRTAIHEVKVDHIPNPSLIHGHPEDSEMYCILESIHDRVSSVSNQPLLKTVCPLEGRGAQIRNFESNLGNMLADAVRAYYDVDVAFVNSGSIRCDRVVESGVLTVRDAIDILPFDNSLLVKRVPASNLLQALENSVSDSRTDGRFLQFSGLSILVDLGQPEGSRILEATLGKAAKRIAHGMIESELDFSVSVAMSAFIGDGFDGFFCMRDDPNGGVHTLVGFEGAMSDTGLLLQLFRKDRGVQDDEGLSRARRAITLCSDDESGLLVINPSLDGRISFKGCQ